MGSASSPKPSAKQASSASPLDRAICDFGWKKLDRIQDEYMRQITTWKKAFKQVLGAFSLAIVQRDSKLEEAKRQRERDAAVAAAILELLTAGSMRFLGAYVQYTFLPNKFRRTVHRIEITDGFLNVIEKPIEFSKVQASALGGVVQDVGKAVVPQLMGEQKFPEPQKKQYRLDTWAGVGVLEADLDNNIDESAKTVFDQLDKAKNWMNESTEFGTTWAKRGGGTLGTVQQQIDNHLNKLRADWAAESEFFGRTPNPPQRQLLADHYERALWADHTLHLLTPDVVAWVPEKPRPPKTLREILDAIGKPGNTVGNPVLEETIVDRLKQLNIVLGETVNGRNEQIGRILAGAPVPTTVVEGSVDYKHEAKNLISWAAEFVKKAPTDTERKFFPSASLRKLEPI